MKVKNMLVLFLILLFVVAIAAYIIQDHIKPKQIITQEFDFKVTSGKKMGFNLDKDKLHFGWVCSVCSAIRNFTLTNNQKYNEKVRFWVAYEQIPSETVKNLKELVWFSPYFGVIEPNQTLGFVATVDPTSATPQGNYTGIIIIKIYRAWPWESTPDTKEYLPLKGCFSKDLWDIIYCQPKVASSKLNETNS